MRLCQSGAPGTRTCTSTWLGSSCRAGRGRQVRSHSHRRDTTLPKQRLRHQDTSIDQRPWHCKALGSSCRAGRQGRASQAIERSPQCDVARSDQQARARTAPACASSAPTSASSMPASRLSAQVSVSRQTCRRKRRQHSQQAGRRLIRLRRAHANVPPAHGPQTCRRSVSARAMRSLRHVRCCRLRRAALYGVRQPDRQTDGCLVLHRAAQWTGERAAPWQALGERSASLGRAPVSASQSAAHAQAAAPRSRPCCVRGAAQHSTAYRARHVQHCWYSGQTGRPIRPYSKCGCALRCADQPDSRYARARHSTGQHAGEVQQAPALVFRQACGLDTVATCT
jgi:hypothetical protein